MAKARKEKFLSVGKNVVAISDTRFSVTFNDITSSCTVRHVNCELLTMGSQQCCKTCSKYRGNLWAMYSNFSKQKSWNRNVNTRYLRTPQKRNKLRSLKKDLANKRRQVQQLKAKLQADTEAHDKHSEEIAKLPMHDF